MYFSKTTLTMGKRVECKANEFLTKLNLFLVPECSAECTCWVIMINFF